MFWLQNEVEEPDVPKSMERADIGAAELTLDECDEGCAASDDEDDDDADDGDDDDELGEDSECSCELQDAVAVRLKQASGQPIGSSSATTIAHPCAHVGVRYAISVTVVGTG